MQFEAVYDSVLDEFADSGVYGLSVTAEANVTAHGLIEKYPRRMAFIGNQGWELFNRPVLRLGRTSQATRLS